MWYTYGIHSSISFVHMYVYIYVFICDILYINGIHACSMWYVRVCLIYVICAHFIWYTLFTTRTCAYSITPWFSCAVFVKKRYGRCGGMWWEKTDAFQALFREVAHGFTSPARCIPMNRGGPLKEKMKEKQLEERRFKKDDEIVSYHQSATQRNQDENRDHHFLLNILQWLPFPRTQVHPVSASI